MNCFMLGRGRFAGFHGVVSEPVGDALPTYTARITAIHEILSKHVTMAGPGPEQSPRQPHPAARLPGRVLGHRSRTRFRPSPCRSTRWTTSPQRSRSFRYGADLTRGAYEAQRTEPDEFALVQEQLGSLWVVVGHREVYLAHRDIAPEKLVGAAVEIARTVGHAPYTDDYEPPQPR